MRRRTILVASLASSFNPLASRLAHAQSPRPLDIANTIERLPAVLQSDFAKVGLSSTVRAIYTFRRQARPMGYEGKSDWEDGFNKAFQAFTNRLWTSDLNESAKIALSDRRALDEFEKAYTAQRDKFLQFRNRFAEVPNAPPYLRGAPPDLTERAQLYFAAILRAVSRDDLVAAASITAIWPFCG